MWQILSYAFAGLIVLLFVLLCLLIFIGPIAILKGEREHEKVIDDWIKKISNHHHKKD